MENLDKLFKLAKLLKQHDLLTIDQQTMVQGHLEDAMSHSNFIMLMAHVEELQDKLAAGVSDAGPAPEPVGYASEIDVKSGMQFKTFDTWQGVRDYYGPNASVVPVWSSAPVLRPVTVAQPNTATVTPISGAGVSGALTAKEASAVRATVFSIYDQLSVFYSILNQTTFPGCANAINQCVAIVQLIDSKIGPEGKRVSTSTPSMAEVINHEIRKQSS